MADKILNTGLDALLGDVEAPNKQSIKEIDLNQIKPNRYQPRQSFDEQKIIELSQSIKKHGILSPILVRETGAGGYELIAGERRLRAAKKAGLQTAPCMVDAAEDQLSLELALIENLQREDLNPIEEAEAYMVLSNKYGHSIHFWDLRKRKNIQTVDFGENYALGLYENQRPWRILLQGPSNITKVIDLSNKAVATSVDSSAVYCWAHPLTGGKQIVCESWRNLISVGASPIAITNCLNFGSPENEENMGEFVECVQGIGEASSYLKFPVVSGNVSFYNQTKEIGIKPTPSIGGVGLIRELSNTMTSLESCSAANQPGMNPRVTGWAIIIAKHMIASILNNKIINF